MADLRQLRYFVTLAETLHFGRAAERLHMTQPPLTRQIAALEESLGVRLLDRGTRHTALTHAGARFLEDARAALAAFDQACRNARLAESGELGELRIGFMMHAAFTVIPRLTKRFISAHPRVKIHLMEALPISLPEDVASGRFDAGVLFDPGAVKGLEFRAVHSEKFSLVVPKDHTLARRSRITPAQLEHEPLIAAPQAVAPALREAITGWFRRGSVTPVFRLETQLQQTILSLVAEGLGVALVPESMAKLGGAGVVFRSLENAPRTEHGVAWLTRNRNPSLPLFLKSSGVLP